jgi:hypothetical protein
MLKNIILRDPRTLYLQEIRKNHDSAGEEDTQLKLITYSVTLSFRASD